MAVDNRRNADALNSRLRQVPNYQAALAGQDFGYGFPVGPDGKVLPGFRVQNARAAARAAGVVIGPGEVDSKTGEFQDPDRGLGRALLARPELMIPLVLGGGYAVGSLLGPAAAGAAAFDAAPAVHSAAGAANLASISGTGLPAGTAALGGVTPAATAGGAEAARSLTSRLRDDLLSPEGLVTAGSIAASLAGRGDGMNDQTRATEEQARRLQAITEARMRRVDPLHEAITQLAFSRLPVSSRNGINLTRVALPE